MKLKITQSDIDKPTIKQLNTDDKCMLAIAAKRLFKGKRISVAYTNEILVGKTTYLGDSNMYEFLKVLRLVANGIISRQWLKPMTFTLTEINGKN